MASYQSITSPEAVKRSKLKSDVGSGNVLAYPSVESPHFMHLTFVEYQATDPQINKFKVPNSEIAKHFILPLPSNLQDSYGVNYAGTEFGIVGRGLQVAGEALKTGLELGDVLGGGAGAARALLRKVATLDAGASGAIDRMTGATLNPHLTLTFEGVQLRTFQFNWKVYPQSPEESYALRNILSHLKLLMHPYKPDEFLLDYPFECYGQFFADGEFLYRIGRSVLKNLNIDYAPGGAPTFFKGTHAPTYITFSMDLQEVSYLTQNDLAEIDQDVSYTAYTIASGAGDNVTRRSELLQRANSALAPPGNE